MVLMDPQYPFLDAAVDQFMFFLTDCVNIEEQLGNGKSNGQLCAPNVVKLLS